jgi:hypothetical protein
MYHLIIKYMGDRKDERFEARQESDPGRLAKEQHQSARDQPQSRD